MCTATAEAATIATRNTFPEDLSPQFVATRVGVQRACLYSVIQMLAWVLLLVVASVWVSHLCALSYHAPATVPVVVLPFIIIFLFTMPLVAMPAPGCHALSYRAPVTLSYRAPFTLPAVTVPEAIMPLATVPPLPVPRLPCPKLSCP